MRKPLMKKCSASDALQGTVTGLNVSARPRTLTRHSTEHSLMEYWASSGLQVTFNAEFNEHELRVERRGVHVPGFDHACAGEPRDWKDSYVVVLGSEDLEGAASSGP